MIRYILFIWGILIFSVITYAGTYSGGKGTSEYPYLISTTADWVDLTRSSDDWDKKFILTGNIDLSNQTLMPVGNSSFPFKGIFDGKGHSITNASLMYLNNIDYQDSSNYIGLFGRVVDGIIRNLRVEDIFISGNNYVGGLVGLNVRGRIYRCHASGSVIGYDEVGGLVGSNIGGICSCYAACSVNGRNRVGGLMGENWDGGICCCYASGSVVGSDNVGGLVGYCIASDSVNGNDCRIEECYAVGKVIGTKFVGGLVGEKIRAKIFNCFWDTEASGIADHEAGKADKDGMTGKTTSEMQDFATFTKANWDFQYQWQIRYYNYPEFLSCDISYEIQLDRIPQAGNSLWSDCGLGKPRLAFQTDPCTLEKMRKFPDHCVGLNSSDVSYSTMDSCGNYVSNQWKIGYEGCSLCCATMIINSICGTPYDPAQVNKKDIFDFKNDVNWSSVAELITRERNSMYTNIHYNYNGCNLKNVITHYICTYKVPVAVRVDNRHTVVAYAVKRVSQCDWEISIRDPSLDNHKSLDEYTTVNHIDAIIPQLEHNQSQCLCPCIDISSSSYTLAVKATGGSVAISPDKTKLSYSSGETVILTASPSEGYIFKGWSGDIIGSNNPFTITMNNNKTIIANFMPDNIESEDCQSTLCVLVLFLDQWLDEDM